MMNRLKNIVSQKSIVRVRRYWLSLAFFFGFLLDNITLNRVDQLFDNFVLFSYVILAMGSILYLYAGAAGKLPKNWIPHANKYAPLLLQFSFGGLLSGMLIFYGRSGSWTESWPFLLMILAVIYGNETIRDRSSRLVFNLAIFFVGLFSYTVLVIPVFTGYMGAWIFVGSGVLSLFIMRGFVYVLSKIIPNFINLKKKVIIFTIGTIFIGFNFLYFTNIIPPIPLSIKDIGIYHSVVRFENGDYQLKYEDGSWWQFFRDSDDTFHPSTSNSIFCFAQVFAPTRLSTDIFHNWEYYDDTEEHWISHTRLSYPIAGGRDNGFRGYTLIENFRDGKWRCSVETGRGQVLGRETFTIDATTPANELVTRTE